MNKRTILLLPGDNIGIEIVAEAEKVLRTVDERFKMGLTLTQGVIGGAAIDQYDDPFPDVTLQQARTADAILLGAVGGPKWD